MAEKLAAIGGRNNFGDFLNKCKLLGKAVEIGTHQGVFAEILLRRWEGEALYCVDPWVPGYDKGDPASQGDRETDYNKTLTRLRPYLEQKRVAILREYSVQASRLFEDNQIDFVYIDGCHQAKSVEQDIEAWWPKLKPGGLLAGHDIISGTKPGKGWDQFIRPTVRRFANHLNLDVWLVPELPGKNWSCYIVKK